VGPIRICAGCGLPATVCECKEYEGDDTERDWDNYQTHGLAKITQLTAQERLRAEGAMNALEIAGVRIKELQSDVERLQQQIKHLTNAVATALEENISLNAQVKGWRLPVTDEEINRFNPGLLEVDFANDIIRARS